MLGALGEDHSWALGGGTAMPLEKAEGIEDPNHLGSL